MVSYTMCQAPSSVMATSQSPLNGWLGDGSTRRYVSPASVETHSGDACVKPPWLQVRTVRPSRLTASEVSASPPGPARTEGQASMAPVPGRPAGDGPSPSRQPADATLAIRRARVTGEARTRPTEVPTAEIGQAA